MQRLTRMFAVCCLSVCTLPFAQAGNDDPLSLLPADAHVIIRVQAPEKTVQDLADFVNSIQPGAGGMILGQQPAIGAAIGNPGLVGVDMSRDWYVAINVNKGGPPQTALLLPTTDAEAMQTAMGSLTGHAIGDWVAFARNERDLADIKSCEQGDAESVSLSDDLKAAFSGRHVAILINGTQVKEKFADELEQMEAQWEGFVNMIVAQIQATSPQTNVESVQELYSMMGRTAIQIINDTDSLLLTVNVADGNLEIGEMLSVTPDSASGRYLSAQKSTSFSQLAKMPTGLQGYLGVNVDVQPMMDWSLKMMVGALSEDPEVAAKLKTQFESVRDWKVGEMCLGGGFSEEGGMQYLQRTELAPGKVVREFMQAFGDLGKVTVSGIEQEYDYQRAAENVAGLEVDVLNVTQTIPEGFDPTGMAKDLIEAMYGENGMQQRVAVDDDVIYQVVGGDLKLLGALVTGDAQPTTAWNSTRAAHPEQLNVMGMIDLPATVLSAMKMFSKVPQAGIPVDEQMLDAIQFPESYVGFSMVATKDRLDVLTTIPASTLQNFFMGVTRVQQF
ncbi:MAG: hypothetical protein NXI04_13415 [Planctomycetaceae bacterium]|nr:hypothetical protein [Planctomycetaceae bacterium]